MSLGLSIPAHIQQNQIKHHRFNMQVLQREHISFFFFPLLATWSLFESAPLDVAQWHSMVKDEAGVKEQLCLLWSCMCTSGQSCLSTVQSVLTWKLSQGHCKIKHLALQPLCALERWDSLPSSPLFSLIAIGFTEYFFHMFGGEKKAHCECCWVLQCLSDSGGHPAPHRIRPSAKTSSKTEEKRQNPTLTLPKKPHQIIFEHFLKLRPRK